MFDALRNTLPRGQGLPDDVWHRRHRAILALLWVHAGVIPIYALIRHVPVSHTVAESLVLPAFAAVALVSRSRPVQTLSASIGLLSSSAILVHLSGGLIEMHFHFFIMVATVSLYQAWSPFLAAIGYVLLHHGVAGTIDPASVFNHPAAIAAPWKWAGIHALFVGGISVACLVNWRLNETYFSERREAEQRLREETRIVETLNEVGKTLAADLDMQSVVQHVTDAATQMTGAQFGAFFYNVVDASGESYMLYTISGVDPAAFERFPMPRNTPLFAETFAGKGVVRLDDVRADPRYGQMPPYHGMLQGHLPVRSYLAVPVRSRSGAVIGGLFFGHREPARFGATAERLATGIAAHAAIAIDNAQIYESERVARARAQAVQSRVEIMAEASRALAASLELGSTLQGFAEAVAPAVADVCEVYLHVDDGSFVRAASVGARAGDDGAVDGESSSGFAGAHDVVAQAATTMHPVTVTDHGLDGWVRPPESSGGHGASAVSTVAVPLVRRSDVLGVLVLGTDERSGRRLTAEDVALCEELGRRVAIAIENAQLYATKRTAADTLQHSLLPETLPRIPGLGLAARYVPGGPGVDVGGDWYDVIPLRDGSLGLAMGDVVGRGVTAASLMGQLRNALRAYAVEGGAPGEIVARLNDLLYDAEIADNPMATLLYAIYDPETGTLRMANAGHPPPLVVDPDGEAAFLEITSGVPIGAVPGAVYPESLTTLRPGTTLMLYTDGLVEDRATTLEDGLARFREIVRSGPKDLEELCDWVLGCSPARDASDDVAILAVRSTEIGDRLSIAVPTRPSSLKPLRATVRRWLAAAGASEEETFDILVALGEACSNAIQHAGPSLESFEVTAWVDDGVVIEVRDRGRWRRPRPSLGGRGLAIMQQFMDVATVTTDERGTIVRMKRSLSGRSLGVTG